MAWDNVAEIFPNGFIPIINQPTSILTDDIPFVDLNITFQARNMITA